MSKIKNILAGFMVYITISGLVTFSLFICEESFQTTMFGTWPAQDAKRWDIVKNGTVLMEKITKTMKVMTYAAGWIQPLAFVSYKAYGESAEFYITALKAKTFAHAPELFVGENVEFTFTPREIKQHDNSSLMLVSGKLNIIIPGNKAPGQLQVKGFLDHNMVIDMR